MSTPVSAAGRLLAYFQFLLAIFYILLARAVATHGAAGLVFDPWTGLVEQTLFVLLLALGFTCFSFWSRSEGEQGIGFPLRAGWLRESALGLAAGWALAVVCVLVLALSGGIAVSITPRLSQWGWLLVEVAFFALMALGEEIALRGYAFQRLSRSVGPLGASLLVAAFYAILQSLLPGAARSTVVVALLFSLALSATVVRTRALWVSWGINFGWKASRALLFGLAVDGLNTHSPVVQGNPMGSFWLTGGSFGLESSWFVALLLLGFLPLVFRLTAELNDRYNPLVIEPGGIPVDIDALVRAQHEAAAPSEPAAAPLVQILPAAAPALTDPPEQS